MRGASNEGVRDAGDLVGVLEVLERELVARHRAFTLFDVEDESKSEAYSEAVVHECEYFAQEELY